VKVAHKLEIPSLRSPSSVTRYGDPLGYDPDSAPTKREASLTSVMKAFEVMLRANKAIEYITVFDKLSPSQLAYVFMNSISTTYVRLVKTLWEGEVPTRKEQKGLIGLKNCQDHNVPGIYLHLGRAGKLFKSGVSRGSRAGETADTFEGTAGLVGVLKRIAQHNSSKYRAAEDKKEGIRLVQLVQSWFMACKS
jgi:hypothetical protein